MTLRGSMLASGRSRTLLLSTCTPNGAVTLKSLPVSPPQESSARRHRSTSAGIRNGETCAITETRSKEEDTVLACSPAPLLGRERATGPTRVFSEGARYEEAGGGRREVTRGPREENPRGGIVRYVGSPRQVVLFSCRMTQSREELPDELFPRRASRPHPLAR